MGCRTRKTKDALLRLTADDRGHLRLDVRKRREGRGVYVCAALECIEAACQRSAWQRGLRRRVAQATPNALARTFSEALRRELADAARAALRDGRGVQRDDRCAVSGCVVEGVRVTDRRLQTELESMLDLLRQLEVRVR